jgi:hypothetical protein
MPKILKAGESGKGKKKVRKFFLNLFINLEMV